MSTGVWISTTSNSAKRLNVILNVFVNQTSLTMTNFMHAREYVCDNKALLKLGS